VSQKEYAARGGLNETNTTYAGSNTIGDVAWYYSNSGSKTHIVGGKGANECGLYDMSGNLREWCWDRYNSYSGGTDPTGASSGSSRVFRGGSCDINASFCTVSIRSSYIPAYEYYDFGFRFVSPVQ